MLSTSVRNKRFSLTTFYILEFQVVEFGNIHAAREIASLVTTCVTEFHSVKMAQTKHQTPVHVRFRDSYEQTSDRNYKSLYRKSHCLLLNFAVENSPILSLSGVDTKCNRINRIFS